MLLTSGSSLARRIVEKAVRALFQNPDLFWVERINEVGLVGCNKNLRVACLPACVFTEFMGQCFQEFVIQAVFPVLRCTGTAGESDH